MPIEMVLRMKFLALSCLNTTKYRCLRCNFHCATNAHFQEKTTKFQVGKLESLLRSVCALLERSLQAKHTILNTCCRRRKCSRSFWSNQLLVSLMKECARACLSYMHESSLLRYLHIPSVFPNQHPGYRELKILP